MKIKFKLKMAMLLVALIAAGVSSVGAFPTETHACNSPGCHAYPPKLLNISTNITNITVSPGQNFTVGITWSGGANDNSTLTAVKWPTDFTLLGIMRDNSLFNITPILPVVGTNASGTTSSTLTAPTTPGNYTVRVHASTGNWVEIPTHETNFSDINVTVTAPVVVSALTTIMVSPSTATLNVNGTQNFTATALDQNNTPMIGVNITWTVSNSTVGNISSVNATTDTNGTASTMFTALATGATMVNATSGNVTGNASVTVNQSAVVVPVLTTITVSPSTATLNVSRTQNFTATALDQNSTPMAGVNITWTVDNSTVGNVSTLNTVTDINGTATTTFMALAAGNAMVNATNGTVSGSANVTVTAPTPGPIPTAPKLTLTLNNTMDGTAAPLVSNITSAVLLNTSGAQVETATLPDNMTAQFNLSGISPSDYFIEVNGLAGDHLPTRIDSNASDISQTVGLRLRNSVIGNISNPTYRIKVYASGSPPVVNSSHPVVNYATGANESIYNFVIVPGNTSRIEVRALNTSEELSNFTPTSDTHPAGANFSSEPFQIWILGDVINSTTGAFIGNHGHLYNNTDSNCNTCHGNLSTKASAFSDITPSNGWCFRCHYGKTGPRNGFVDPRVVIAANGTIAGNVTNASSGMAISGAIVTANGMVATTDTNGSYNMSIAADTYTVTASATGFQSNTTTGVVVTAGNVTTQDFALIPTAAPIVTGPQLVLTLNASSSGSKASNFTSAVLLNKTGAIVESASSISADGLTTTFNLTGIMPDFYFIEVNGLSGDRVPTFIDNNATNISQVVTKGLTTTTVGDATNPAKYRIKARSGGMHPIVNYFTGKNETGLPFVIVYNDTSPGKIEVREVNTSRLLTNFTPSSLSNTTHAGLQAGTTFQSWQLNLGASLPGFTGLLNHGQIYNNTDSLCNVCHGTNMNTKPVNYSDVGTGFSSGANSGGSGWCFKCHYGGTNGGDSNGFVDPTMIVAANGTIAGNVTNASSSLPISGATITADGMTATTDTNGSYSMSIAAGTYNVTASATGFQSNTTTGVVVTAGNVTTQDFALIPTAAPIAVSTFNISGFKINNATGSGIPGWNITLMNSTMQTSMLTDMNGSYMFTGLVNGTYNVSEEMKTGFTPVGATIQTVTINGSDVTNVNFTNNPVSAVNRTFVADLTGGEEVPPEVTLARANATFNLSDDGTVLQFKITVANITNVTASHIHLAPVGVNGSIVVNLFTGPTKVGRFDGVLAEGNITQANLTGPLAGQPFSALLDNMTNGNTYVNIHTTQHPAGEIRGQIRVAPVPNARFSISGFKINNATGNGIQDWNITLRNGATNALVDSKPTDANGFYQFIVLVNGSYNVSEEMKPGFTPTNATSMQVTVENMDVMNVNFTNMVTVTPSPPQATFNISGFKINNVTGSGVQGWNITLTNSTMQTSMPTGVDGSYMFTNLANGTYNVTEGTMAGWMNVSPMSQQVTIAGSDMMNINFTNQPPTAVTFNISGFKINDTNGNGVWNSGEMGIENWNINLLDATGVLIDRQSTDATGFYQFTDVAPGVYNVTEEMKPGFTPTNATSMPVTVENMDVTNVNFTNQVTVTPSPQAAFNISGFKINGTNNNGMGIPNWSIMLLNATGAQIASTMTDNMGFYNFAGLTNGTYNVTEGMKTGWTNISPMSQIVTINGADKTNVNFTNMLLTPTPAATFNISGFKINDTDGNGVWNPGEMGIAGWNIMLLNDTGVQLANTLTDASGFYQFMNIFPGKYNIVEEMKPGFTATNATNMPVTVENMDVMNVNFTNMVTVTPPPQATFSISGFKVNDTDGNGVWDQGEMGIEGWNIMLLDDKGTQIASTSTNPQGFYEFTNLAPGTYKVTEEMKEGFTPSSATSKEVTLKDMDITDVNFLNHVTVTPPPVTNTISGFKINDLNGNGKQDQGENGLPGWKIKLTGIVGMGTETKAINLETTTNADGFYMFDNLPAGSYIVTEELQGGFVPVGSIVKNIILADGENSENNNFFNKPVESIIPDTSNG